MTFWTFFRFASLLRLLLLAAASLFRIFRISSFSFRAASFLSSLVKGLLGVLGPGAILCVVGVGIELDLSLELELGGGGGCSGGKSGERRGPNVDLRMLRFLLSLATGSCANSRNRCTSILSFAYLHPVKQVKMHSATFVPSKTAICTRQFSSSWCFCCSSLELLLSSLRTKLSEFFFSLLLPVFGGPAPLQQDALVKSGGGAGMICGAADGDENARWDI